MSIFGELELNIGEYYPEGFSHLASSPGILGSLSIILMTDRQGLDRECMASYQLTTKGLT
jgi:hypothetical protein